MNRTVISDTSDDGTHFFFHSTSYHNFEGPKESNQDAEEETEVANVKPAEPETPFDEFPQATIEYEEIDQSPTIKSNEIPFLDDSLNEVLDDENVGNAGGIA